MSLRKTADIESPHATYVNDRAGWEWRVLKVNAPSKSPREQYSTWLVAAKSPNTFGSWEYGDTYCHDVMNYGRNTQASDEFNAYIQQHIDAAGAS